MIRDKSKRLMYPSHCRNHGYLPLLVLIPVLIASAVNFCILSLSTMSTIENDLEIESYRVMEVLNTHLSSMSNIVNSRRSDQAFSSQAQVKVGTAYYPIIQQLRKDALWMPFFSNIHYYSLESDIIYKANSAASAEEFFLRNDGRSRYSPNNIIRMQDKAESYLREPGNHTRTIRVRNANSSNDGILFALPLEMSIDGPPLKCTLDYGHF